MVNKYAINIFNTAINSFTIQFKYENDNCENTDRIECFFENFNIYIKDIEYTVIDIKIYNFFMYNVNYLQSETLNQMSFSYLIQHIVFHIKLLLRRYKSIFYCTQSNLFYNEI